MLPYSRKFTGEAQVSWHHQMDALCCWGCVRQPRFALAWSLVTGICIYTSEPSRARALAQAVVWPYQASQLGLVSCWSASPRKGMDTFWGGRMGQSLFQTENLDLKSLLRLEEFGHMAASYVPFSGSV